MTGAPPAIRLDGETRVFIIIGDPIAQVKSPGGLSAILAARGENAVVVPGHVGAADVDAFMAGIAVWRNVAGVVATIPHKQALAARCTTLTERARVAGAANVMRRAAGGWTGDNTDGCGFVDSAVAAGQRPEDTAVLVVGAGGAGSAVAYEFLARGAASLDIHDVDAGRRDGLVARLAARFGPRVRAGTHDPTGYDIVANVTPVGMAAGDPYPVDVDKLTADQFCGCAITKPDPSPFIARARDMGCRTMTGAAMFAAQAELVVAVLLGEAADGGAGDP